MMLDMEQGRCFILRMISLMENGITGKNKEEEFISLTMVMIMKVIGNRVKEMEEDYIHGKLEKRNYYFVIFLIIF